MQDTGAMKVTLEAFLAEFEEYSDYLFGAKSYKNEEVADLRKRLQLKEPLVTDLIVKLVGNISHTLGPGAPVKQRHLLGSALLGGNNAMLHNFRGFYEAVGLAIRQAIGTIDAGLWVPTGPEPVLKIHDEELKNRCEDLLAAPGNFDRVIREATTVLEDRIQRKPPKEFLAKLIPNTADLTLENLVNQLYSPNHPLLIISDDANKQRAFHRMLLGVASYLRNDYHHHLDSETEWSWAWSIAGLIDQLLLDIDQCTFMPPSATGD